MTMWEIWKDGVHITNFFEIGLAKVKKAQLERDYPNSKIEIK